MSEKIVLIDGHSILNRAFYGIPELTNSEGLHTNAVYGFLNILFKILDEEKAQYLAVAFDLKAPTFRHKMYAEYKGTRKAMPEELREQVPVMKEVLSAMGVPLLMKEGYEADDLLGTIAGQAERLGLEVSIVSGDRDLLQLATDKVQIQAFPRPNRTEPRRGTISGGCEREISGDANGICGCEGPYGRCFRQYPRHSWNRREDCHKDHLGVRFHRECP